MDIWRFNIRHLRAFLKTVELGTSTAAARAVNLSQPAVTQAIAKLEDQLDFALFDRQSGGLVPTDAAKLIYPRIVETLNYIGRKNVTHTQIKAFLALAQCGNFAEASNSTGLSSASLHRAIRDLEIFLKQDLTRRKGRGLALTDFGQTQARRFSLAGAELRYMINDLMALKGIASGSIVIGAMPLCRARVLPAAVVEFQASHPNVDIRISEGSFTELIEPLLSGQLDFMIGALREHGSDPGLVHTPLFEDAPVVVARTGHPLFDRLEAAQATVRELAEFSWCVPHSNSPLREKWEALFTAEGLPVPRISVECGSVIVNRQILLRTDCLTILSPDQVAVELEAGWLSVLCSLPPLMNRKIGVTYRQDWRPTSSHQSFIGILESVS